MYKKRLFILYLLVALTGASCTKSLPPVVDQAKPPQLTVHEPLIREPLFGKPLKKDKEEELLKKELRLLNEKYQSEVAALQQENDQLKRDLQLLKNLELQLDKREK